MNANTTYIGATLCLSGRMLHDNIIEAPKCNTRSEIYMLKSGTRNIRGILRHSRFDLKICMLARFQFLWYSTQFVRMSELYIFSLNARPRGVLLFAHFNDCRTEITAGTNVRAWFCRWVNSKRDLRYLHARHSGPRPLHFLSLSLSLQKFVFSFFFPAN